MFAKPLFYSASTFMTGSAQTNTVFVSGFEMLAVLDLLTREAALSNSIVLASSRALLPTAWEPSPSAQAHISSMLETTRSRGLSIFVPGDTESASSIPPKTDPLIQIFPTDTIASIKAHYRPETFLPAPALTGFAPSRLPGEKFSGAAPAAAWAAGMACMARSIVPQASPAEISEILLRSSELRGEILPVRSFFNHGLLSPRLVSSVSSNRKFFSNLLLRFERMAENPYKDAESLFCDGFLKTLAPGTHILPIPETLIEKRFTKAYQYFDRNALYSGRPTTAPRYDANESFIPTNAERQELALVSWKGSLFLFCTRNGNRGWIINYGSLPAEGAAHGFDADDGLFFLATRHGEIIILDPASGLMLPVVMQTSSGNFRYAAIPTDHGNGQLSMSVDARHNALWITGSGSRFLTRLTWSRTGGLVYVRYDEDLDAHKIPLADVPFSPLTQLDHYISPAILHANGTFNILKSGKQPQYLRFDARGAVTPGAKQPRPETPPEP
jgi:hypothetical protein